MFRRCNVTYCINHQLKCTYDSLQEHETRPFGIYIKIKSSFQVYITRINRACIFVMTIRNISKPQNGHWLASGHHARAHGISRFAYIYATQVQVAVLADANMCVQTINLCSARRYVRMKGLHVRR